MRQPDSTFRFIRHWRLSLLSCAIGLPGLTLLFIKASPWLIAGMVLASMLVLLAYVYLPLKPAALRENTDFPANVIPLSGKVNQQPAQRVAATKTQDILSSVLIIEDNPVALVTLSRLFTALGAEQITESTSAEHALEVLKNQRFSLILTDYQLGGMSGVQLLETIRQQGNQTPLIVLSATPDQPGVLKTASFNHTDFFGKPLKKQELVNTINRFAQAVA